MSKGDTLLSLARDRMQDLSNSRNRLTTKASIAFSALGILAAAKLPESMPMGSLVYASLIGMYTCIFFSAFFIFHSLNTNSYSPTPLPLFLTFRHKKAENENLKLVATIRINNAFRRNAKTGRRLAKSFSRGLKFLMGALFFRMVIHGIDFAKITF